MWLETNRHEGQLAWLLAQRATGRGKNGDGTNGKLPMLEEAIAQAETEAIHRALAAAGGNRNRAAEILAISPATLYRRMDDRS